MALAGAAAVLGVGSLAQAQQGACCVPGQNCYLAPSSTACQSQGGTFVGGTCSTTACGNVTSCCRGGYCVTIPAQQCQQYGFTVVQGACSPNNPCDDSGACCLRTGQCVSATRTECESLSGKFIANKPCNPNPCVPTTGGACCIPATGGCVQVSTASQCNGVFVSGVACGTVPCAPTGACCTNGQCQVKVKDDCPAGSSFFQGSSCSPTVCPSLTGACCTATAGCVVVPNGQCPPGADFYLGQGCNPNPCDPQGACCLATAGCVITPKSQCAGQWIGSVVCSATDCPRGACCNTHTGRCFVSFAYNCTSPKLTYLGDGTTCTPTSCAPQFGACCVAGAPICVATTKSQCNGTWFSGAPCAPNPCRPADFDGDGTVGVPDIFAFLSAFFAAGTP